MPLDLSQLSQLGVGLATLLILWVVVKYFIAAITAKDNQMQAMIKGFNETINNHIVHEMAQRKEEIVILRELASAINKLAKKR